ncbi:MAG: amino acid adenylation domain-containing protein [Chloroflexi bacterium]|nr:amino acid adenylation domain-containing protein [Chloroflexota bacterium]
MCSQDMRDVAPPPDPLPDLCLHQVFAAHAARSPDAIAVSLGTTHLTYRELNARANQLAHYLQTQGVAPDVLVGLHVERSLDTIIGMLAILKAGGAYVPLDPAYPHERLAFMLQDARVAVLLTDTSVNATLPLHQGSVMVVDTQAAEVRRQPDTNPQAAVTPEHLMYVIYTSGSTGTPKGIMVTHANVARLFPATQPYLAFDAHDTWTLFHSYSFGFSVWEIWGALAHGGRLVVVPQAISQSPADFYRLVSAEQVTVLSQTPSAFRLFLLADADLYQQCPLQLRYIVFSGEPLDPMLLMAWMERHGDEQPQLINMYAITETAGEITYRRLRMQDATSAARNVIGVPLPDVQIYLLDEQQQPVPVGAVGEMYIGSPAVARGYYNLPDLTAQQFLADPFSDDPQARMYKTGDQARYLATGDLEFVGRIDNQVKIRGYRIELGEIESALNQHPDVQQAVVIARDEAGDKRLVAYVVGSTSNPAALRSHLAAHLPDYMVPSAVVPVTTFPLTPNGKIDRGKLPPPEQASVNIGNTPINDASRTAEAQALASIWGVDTAPAAPPASPQAVPHAESVLPAHEIEERLIHIVKKVLLREHINPTSNFFDLGATSFDMVRLHSILVEEFQITMSVVDIFQYVTIRSLAQYLRQSHTDTASTQTQRQERGKARRAARRR